MKNVTMMFGALALALAGQASAKELNNASTFPLVMQSAQQAASVKAILGCTTSQVGVVKSNKGYAVVTCDPLGQSKSASFDCKTGEVKPLNYTKVPMSTPESRRALRDLCR